MTFTQYEVGGTIEVLLGVSPESFRSIHQLEVEKLSYSEIGVRVTLGLVTLRMIKKYTGTVTSYAKW